MQNEIINHIVDSITVINPDRIILFGSYARGDKSTNSDIDLLVVTGDDFIPRSFNEKSSIYQKVSNLITDIEREVPVDLIVHTRPMYKKFMELGSMFSKKLASEGIVLYEKNI
jgi:predicted nucleotidyltransferase